MLYTNPLYGFLMTLFLFLMGRVQFLKQEVGSTIAMKDGQRFKIFRRVIIKRFNGKSQTPEALFIVRFSPKMEIRKNIGL